MHPGRAACERGCAYDPRNMQSQASPKRCGQEARQSCVFTMCTVFFCGDSTIRCAVCSEEIKKSEEAQLVDASTVVQGKCIAQRPPGPRLCPCIQTDSAPHRVGAGTQVAPAQAGVTQSRTLTSSAWRTLRRARCATDR